MDRPSLDVIVADDDESTRHALYGVVRALGHRCRTASDGDEAWDMLANQPADVVVSDWCMPRMTGLELCRRTRAEAPDEAYTYFILMTGAYDREHLFAGMDAGADDFQRKPIDLDELEAKLVAAARVVGLHKRLARHTEELRHDSQRLYLASRTDRLTGVGNRLRLDEELANIAARADRYATRCAIAMCDLDFFKRYNDRFGHLAGDEALRRVTDAMRAHLRACDDLFRYGGEELVVLLHEQAAEEGLVAMERVRAEIERMAIPSGTGNGALTISVGVADLDPSDPEASLARADEALYRAKEAGRNRVRT